MTVSQNRYDEVIISRRQCRYPAPKVEAICSPLKYKPLPFINRNLY
jgi:hypothetical protein